VDVNIVILNITYNLPKFIEGHPIKSNHYKRQKINNKTIGAQTPKINSIFSNLQLGINLKGINLITRKRLNKFMRESSQAFYRGRNT
jgi:hypothetical protein